ncbi:hypothetical protein BDZ94DRAFT_1303886 [Collybia nuda]|uniref:Uncharacterized protein n=1 Tax=Collybia nuda TaxID=64659 RepID=A0A9P5YHK2_9AGAR|nr:hypothetical protein BDZ94DRAFT_1303886 [Collybia nuda]
MLSFPLALVTLFASSALAQTSLYIPGFDPQPISADILGVDAQGRTTWALHQGARTGTFDDSGFIGTATLVEGPNDVSFTFAAPEFTMGIGCSLSGDVAVCSTGTGAEAAVATETISRILVQAGTTAAAAAQTPDITPSPSASPSKSSEPASSGTTKDDSAPNPTNSSSAKSLRPYIATFSITIALVAVFI